MRDVMSYLYLKYFRRWQSAILRFLLERKDRDYPLPVVTTIEECETALQEIRYRSEGIDYISYPGAVWKRKSGDCEDMAVLMAALLRQIGIHGYLISVIAKDKSKSHAACAWYNANKNYVIEWSSNQIVVHAHGRGPASFHQLADWLIMGQSIKAWSVENPFTHTILEIGRTL